MKMFKGFAAGLVIVLLVLAPACRSTRKKNTAGTTTSTVSSTMPDVPITVTQQETTVTTPPEDFVQDNQRPTVEELPRDIEQLNRVAQDRGYVRDAFFNYNESNLSEDAQMALNATANWMRNNPQYNLLIEGHCDERGTEQYNLALGDRRASIVRDYLVTLGIEAGRLRTVSYGEERPFDEGHDESAWRQNRRAHLVLTGTR
jgi:peptidoglycan-associated lipoprotein